MRNLVASAILLCMCFGAVAQTIKAEDLEKLCGAREESDRASCTLIVKVYMDGFIEGVGKGAIGTYKYDPEILAMVRDVKMKDVAPRINKVVELATCIQRVSVAEMTSAYVEFMKKNPALRQDNYRKAMTRAIVATYCEK